MNKYRSAHFSVSSFYDIIPVLDRVQGKNADTRLLESGDVSRALDLQADFSRFGRCWVTVNAGSRLGFSKYDVPTTELTVGPTGGNIGRKAALVKRAGEHTGKFTYITVQRDPGFTYAPAPKRYRGFSRCPCMVGGVEAFRYTEKV